MKLTHIIVTSDRRTGYSALYVDGELRLQDESVSPREIADAASGRAIHFSAVYVDLPEDQSYPELFESLMTMNPGDD